MENEIKLSYILPVYNVEQYVGNCLDTIYAQGLQEEEFEVICVNDGSTDYSLSVLEKYQNVHSNLMIKTIEHSGQSRARKYVSEKDTKKKYLKAGLDSIGREQYNFDYAKEKIIYKYVCHEYIGRKELKTLKSDEKFLSYTEWEAYVKNKYKNSCINGLRNFSRFLNLKMKNKKPVYESLGICIPVLLTLVGDKFFLSDMQHFGDENVDWILPLITILVSVFLGIFVYKLLEPIWNCNVDVNFLKDYKEIIDNMICEKNKFGENSMDSKV